MSAVAAETLEAAASADNPSGQEAVSAVKLSRRDRNPAPARAQFPAVILTVEECSVRGVGSWRTQ
ncbi:hypothetical protein BRAS3843_2210003 [Bradyrhizobium sp. STM 3843]|nr:hypothetical protein BRAS3843_2210003 [Bradyrhizobium sp. STM 3843]